ncbi:MAG: tryptophan--tRNA ligase [Candidatus Aenigmatarchaeota archaeon]
MKEFVVTPWEVKGKIDYEKLVKNFGVEVLDEKTLNQLKKHTHELHYFLERKIFFAHKYFDLILKEYEKGNKFYLYTGRAPSGPVHLGHLVPWIFAKWLQEKFNATLIFQIPDEEKFFFKDELTLEDTKRWAYDNILDIIAVGFDPKKTKIFLDTEYAGHLYKYACMVAKKVTFSTAKALFGFKDSNNLGEIFYTCMQSVPAFLPSVWEKKPTNCLIPCAVDQDVHFRLTRDIAVKLGFPKPATILCKFLPSLTEGGKMSTSVENTAIFTTDTPEKVETKIIKYAFSGGRETVEEHRKKGGIPEIDISYQYLTFYLEDTKKLKQIYEDYKSGKMLTGELKQITIEVINKFLKEHQEKREKAKEKIEEFMLRD